MKVSSKFKHQNDKKKWGTMLNMLNIESNEKGTWCKE
jgi:hypothetical protein